MQVETGLLIYLEPSRARDEEALNTARAMINEKLDSDDGYVELLQNYYRFEFEKTKMYTLDLLCTIIRVRWNDIEKYFDDIFQFLFHYMTSMPVYTKLGLVGCEKLADVQSQFLARSFPTRISNILEPFDAITTNVKGAIVCRFIKMFSYNIAFPKPPIIFHKKMYNDYIQPFCNILFSELRLPVSLEALAHLSRWGAINYQWFAEEPYFNALMNSMHKNGLRHIVADVIASVLSVMDDVPDAFNLIEEIKQAITDYKQETDAQETSTQIPFARLAAAAGNATLDNPEKCTIFFTYCMKFLKHAKNEKQAQEITFAVIDFVNDFVEQTPDMASFVLEIVLYRIECYFASEKLKIDEYCRRLVYLAFTCIKNATAEDGSNALVAQLYEKFNIDISERPNLWAAVMLVIYDSAQLGFAFPEVTQLLKPILANLEEPPISMEVFPCVLGFFRHTLICPEGTIDNETILNLALSLGSYANNSSENPEENDEMRKRFASLYLEFIKKYAKVFNLSETCQLVQAISPNTPNVAQLYSYFYPMLNAADGLQFYMSVIEGLSNPETAVSRFGFLSKTICPADLHPSIGDLITNSLTEFASNPKIFPLIIQSVGCFGVDGLDLLWTLFQKYQADPLIVAHIGSAFMQIRASIPRMAKAQNKPEMVGLLDSPDFIQFNMNIFDAFFNILDKYWASPAYDAQFSLNIITMIIQLINLFRTTIRQFLDEERRNNLFEIAADVLTHHYEEARVFTSVINFAREAADSYPQEVLNFFIKPSMNFLYNVQFSINWPKFDAVVKAVINLHRVLFAKLPDDTFRMIAEVSIESHEAQESAVQEYMEAIQKLNSNPNDSVTLDDARVFYADLAIYR